MDINHKFDQIQATLRDMAPVLWSYFEELKKQGLTDEQALTLVQQVHQRLL